MQVYPPAKQTKRIASVTDSLCYYSRIPVLTDALWVALLGETALGRQLRQPFWLPFQNYNEATAGPVEDQRLRSYLSALQPRFRVYVKAYDDEGEGDDIAVSSGGEENDDGDDCSLDEAAGGARAICFTPLGMRHDTKPTVCVTPEHAKILERARRRVVSPRCSQDDVTELQYCDFATVVGLLHELGHVVWRAKNPIESAAQKHTPPRYKASVGSRAFRGRGEGGERVEEMLWQTVVEFDDILDLSGLPEAALCYESWYRNPGDESTLRRICYRRASEDERATDFVTRDGVRHLCQFLEPNAEARIDMLGFVFYPLKEDHIPLTDGSPRPKRVRAARANMLSESESIESPSVSLDAINFHMTDLSIRLRKPTTIKCGGVKRVSIDREKMDKMLAEEELKVVVPPPSAVSE
ncbi:hypothetical protein FB45DRAFT_1066021 [Roridomyces roridus]|uniref:Uncharacterized protein n=1 Tax=Roridomyces roridus TaxID=1738132 RepID=A0AAD7B5V0_9AGAR|nr:hypothetical protein FB45DRAFT_1066021 [Roridomyces roridus]